MHNFDGAILQLVADKKRKTELLAKEFGLSVVAGVGFEPTTFRL
jgi:hypothetical protein